MLNWSAESFPGTRDKDSMKNIVYVNKIQKQEDCLLALLCLLFSSLKKKRRQL